MISLPKLILPISAAVTLLLGAGAHASTDGATESDCGSLASATGACDRPDDPDAPPGVEPADAVQVTKTFDGSCELRLERAPASPGLDEFASFVLDDPIGTNETLRGACGVRHEIQLARGYRLPAGAVVLTATIASPAQGRGGLQLRVGAPGDTAESSYVTFEREYQGEMDVEVEWPEIDACDADASVRVDTLVTALLRAARNNRDPRRIEIRSLRFPELVPVPCEPVQ